jgi:hypothetical protein
MTFAKLFDHSIVRPDATRAEVIQFGETAARLGTATLTVQPHYVPLAVELLRGTDVLVGTVVGFPHGNETPAIKQYQAEHVLGLGAQEIDMVMNIPALKNNEQHGRPGDARAEFRARGRASDAVGHAGGSHRRDHRRVQAPVQSGIRPARGDGGTRRVLTTVKTSDQGRGAAVNPPITSEGTREKRSVCPFPSWPSPLDPQQ